MRINTSHGPSVPLKFDVRWGESVLELVIVCDHEGPAVLLLIGRPRTK